MKKTTIAAAFVAALAVPTLGHAQTNPSGSITAQATIPGYIQIGATAPLNLGDNITPGTAVNVLATDAQAGYIQLRFNVNNEVTLTTPSVLDRVGGTETLVITFSCAQRDAAAAVSSAATIDCGATHGFTGVESLQDVYFHFGGSISAAATGAALPGVYQGTVILNSVQVN
jgi:hypothetical protein